MPFSDFIVKEAWERCKKYCECTSPNHGHSRRCRLPLEWFRRGINIPGGWEAQHITPIEEGGTDEMINCKIVCIECYQSQLKSVSGFCNITKKEAADRQN